MPVGFVVVDNSKQRLAVSGLDHILLMVSRGGAGLIAATVNVFLWESQLPE